MIRFCKFDYKKFTPKTDEPYCSKKCAKADKKLTDKQKARGWSSTGV